MAHELTTSYLRDSLSLFRYYKKSDRARHGAGRRRATVRSFLTAR